MKNLFTLLFVLHLSFAMLAQESAGIQFEHLSWEETMKKAQEEDKIIFVDAYTTWCGPCKWMTANVFPTEEVGSYYNATFVNLKMDMEKGEGLDFARKYKVRAYPSLLFINGEGELVHQAIGSRAPEDFLDLGHAAMDPDRQAGALMKKYEAGDRSPEFLRKYARAMKESRLADADEAVNTYLDTQKDWTALDNTKFIFDMAPSDKIDHKLTKYIADNKDHFYQVIGQEDVDGKLKMAVLYSVMRQRITDLSKVEAAFAKLFPEQGKQFAAEWNLQQLSRSPSSKDQFLDAAVDYFKKYEADNWNFYNSIAWSVYEMTEDAAYLTEAAKWAEKSVALESNYYNNDTAAAIHLKLKNKAKGIKYAQEAIKLGKKDGEDTSATEDLLKQLNEL